MFYVGRRMSYDQFDHTRCLDRCTVVIDGRSFDVSSTMLASKSQYFDQSFHESAFVEHQTRTINIENSKEMEIYAEDFHNFLRAAYNNREPINGDTYLSLLKTADYFSSKEILCDVETFIMANCNPPKWQSNKTSADKPFAISLIHGIELAFMYNLEKAKEHMKEMLGRIRFHTFLRDYPEVMLLDKEIRIWIFDVYAKLIISSQKV